MGLDCRLRQEQLGPDFAVDHSLGKAAQDFNFATREPLCFNVSTNFSVSAHSLTVCRPCSDPIQDMSRHCRIEHRPAASQMPDGCLKVLRGNILEDKSHRSGFQSLDRLLRVGLLC